MRKLAAGILLAGALIAVPTLAAGAPPQNASSWDGTWAGMLKKGEVAQVIFAGNTFISFFWNGEYTDATGTVLSDAKSAQIVWSGGNATAVRDTDTTAHIDIHEIGRRDVTVALKKDK